MSEIVFVLGAGASKQAGAPLLWDFLDVAEDLLARRQTGADEEAFRLVFKGLDALQAVYAKGSLERINLEAVFASFEMARLLGRLGSLSQEEIEQLPSAMRRLIERTLEMTIDFPLIEGAYEPPRPYGQFAALVQQLCGGPTFPALGRVSVITFNYDLCLDYAFHCLEMQLDYALTEVPAHSALRLLKLHGSMNWVRCPACKAVVDVPLRFDQWALKALF